MKSGGVPVRKISTLTEYKEKNTVLIEKQDKIVDAHKTFHLCQTEAENIKEYILQEIEKNGIVYIK